MEEWKPIVGFDNYLVSDLGRVMNAKRGTIMKQATQRNGYKYVSIRNNEGKQKSPMIHRLVGQAFLGLDVSDKWQVMMHLDDDKTNNVVSNLKVGTYEENNAYKVKGTLGVFQLKDGRWRGYCNYKGKRYNITRNTKEEALAWRESKLTQLKLEEIC